MGQLRKLSSYDKSALWKRLRAYDQDPEYGSDRTALAHLIASTRSVAEQAEYIGDQIVRFMPQYTLHNRRHFLNVLAIMDALIPEEVLVRLTPLECALCIMTAYTHDLGMALQADEERRLHDKSTPEGQRFQTYRAGFGEELRQVERWRRAGGSEAKERIELIEGHILSSFIRETHAAETTGVSRIERWLDAIAEEVGNEKLYTYGNYDFKHDLVLIGLSHGKSASWLRNHLNKEAGDDRGFIRLVGLQESVNVAFPGLLLRLADIIDFDASRTPRILFKHIGIENEQSILEWEKHLSVVGWKLKVRPTHPKLRYEAVCAHPVHEKSIREFIRWIDRELKAVRAEQDAQRRQMDEDERRYELYLPTHVEKRIRPKRGVNGRPLYHYEDIEFRLDQDEILNLLMGESLYGDPSLCIRELLQNALDAVQMRDLRLQMLEKGAEPAEPVDLPRPEELSVTLTWGHDEASGQDYLLVRDNGIGMTKEVVKNYFTQIGKSSYRSPAFERESAMLKALGLQARPISLFGIGILSSFMIADRLHVRTRPGGVNEERRPYDITISGPGSLFWLQEGTLEHQGTEVKLFLKPQYRLEHDAERWLDRLREHFNYKGRTEQQTETNKHIIDPALIAGMHVVWPLYPVVVQLPVGRPVCIDGHFHMDELAPLDKKRILKKAQEWNCPPSYIGEPDWGCWDWTDAVGDDATGSRIRLWFPRNYRSEAGPDLPVDPPPEANLCRQDELAALVEPQLSMEEKGPFQSAQERTVVTVKGMYVDGIEVGERELYVKAGVGCRVWVDLQGAATPRLTADRRRALEPEAAEPWRISLHGVFQRMQQALQFELAEAGAGTVRNLRSGFRWHSSLYFVDDAEPVQTSFHLVSACTPSWEDLHADPSLARWPWLRLLQETLAPHNSLHDLSPKIEHDLARDPYLNFRLGRGITSDFARYRDFACAPVTDSNAVTSLFSLLQAAFFPDLSRSFPMLGCFNLQGNIGDAMLIGPGLVEFELECDGRTVHPVDLQGHHPKALSRFGYDLVFPMTAIPLGTLRKTCPAWRSDRNLRRLGTLPFVLPGQGNLQPRFTDVFEPRLQVDRIFALLPRFELWSKPFDEWTDEDWQTRVQSALWIIETGEVLWAQGAYTVEEMHRVGQPRKTFSKQGSGDGQS